MTYTLGYRELAILGEKMGIGRDTKITYAMKWWSGKMPETAQTTESQYVLYQVNHIKP